MASLSPRLLGDPPNFFFKKGEEYVLGFFLNKTSVSHTRAPPRTKVFLHPLRSCIPDNPGSPNFKHSILSSLCRACQRKGTHFWF